MKIGIVGNGVVGNATAESLRDHVDDVLIYDIKLEKSKNTLDDVLDCDLVMICLPTPQVNAAGALSIDTLQLCGVLSYAHMQRPSGNYVIRSTVPVGFTKDISRTLPNVVHWPEFLTARTAVEDAKDPARIVIGVPDRIVTICCHKLTELCRKVWDGNGPFGMSDAPTPTFVVSSDESEFIKIAQNTISAVKIALMNELRCACDAWVLDWQRCLEVLLYSGWINPMHTQVPGPDGKRGFGGTCLPKDLGCMIGMMLQSGLDASVCSGAYARNVKDRKR